MHRSHYHTLVSCFNLLHILSLRFRKYAMHLKKKKISLHILKLSSDLDLSVHETSSFTHITRFTDYAVACFGLLRGVRPTEIKAKYVLYSYLIMPVILL